MQPGIVRHGQKGAAAPVRPSLFSKLLDWGTMLGPALLLHLPHELLISVLGLLGARDLAAALSSCSSLAALGPQAWRASCFNRWPAWAAVAAGETGAQWRRQYELLSLREAEASCLPSPAAVRKAQQNVTERHRSILTEWLCEVSGRGEWPVALNITW